MRIVALFLGLATALPMHAQQGGGSTATANDSVATVTASGRGDTRITPDRATLSIGVETKAATAAQASADNARKQRAVIDAIKALGISDQQISTADYSVYPETAPTVKTDGVPRIVGYSVTNTVRVDVPHVDQIGALIDAALGKGANTINSLSFYASNEDDARRSALALAVQHARGDAEAMAKGAGGRLGDLIEITSQAGPEPGQPFAVRMSMSAGATPISPGSQTVSAQVTARWRFIKQ